MWLFKRNNNVENLPDALQKNLLESSASFLELYGQHQDNLIQASDALRQLAIQICGKKKEDKQEKTTRALLGGLAGAGLGGTFGAVAGGAGGAYGTIAVVTYEQFCSDVNAAGVSISFAGGVIGGTIGGAFSGGLGGASGAGAEAAGYQIPRKVYDLAWVTVGGATGCAIGGIFGGKVGATGGAIGGAFGGFCGLSVAIGAMTVLKYIVKEIRKTQRSETQLSETQQAEIQRVEVLQKTGRDIQEMMKPLVEELNRIKTITKKVDWRAGVGRVAGQSTKTLTALATKENVLRKIQTSTDEAKIMSWIEEAAQKSTQITEELQKMKAEVEKLLASLTKC